MSQHVDLADLTKLYGTSGSDNNGSTRAAGSNNTLSYDNIAWFSNTVQTMASDASPEEKVQSGVKFGVQFLLSLFGSNEEQALKSETKRIETSSSNLEAARQVSANNTLQAIEQITSSIESNIAELQALLESIEESNQEKEEYQKELQTCQETIETNKQILNDPEATKEEKKEALQAISDVSKMITELSGTINDLIESINERNTQVSEFSEQNEGLNTQAGQVVSTGTQEQQNYQQQQQNLNVENTGVQTRAIKDEGIGAAAKAEAAALNASSNAASAVPIVGGLLSSGGQAMAQKLEQVGRDYSGAGVSGIESFGVVSPILKAVSGLISGDLTAFAEIPTAIGALIDNGNSVSYEYFDYSNAIGSDFENASGLEEEGAALEEAVAEAEKKLEEENEGDAVDNGENTPEEELLQFETPILEELIA